MKTRPEIELHLKEDLPPMPQPDEYHLIERARRDPQAFAELYDRYVDRIYAYTFRQTATRSCSRTSHGRCPRSWT